jgi:hypothetical protein
VLSLHNDRITAIMLGLVGHDMTAAIEVHHPEMMNCENK